MEKTYQALILTKKEALQVYQAMGKRSFKRFILDSAALWLSLKEQMKGGKSK